MKGYDSGFIKKRIVCATTITHSRGTDYQLRLVCSIYDTVIIHWGDGTSQLVSSDTTYRHTYPSQGTWIVQIMGRLQNVLELITFNGSVDEILIHSKMCNLISVEAPYNNLTSLDVSMCYDIGKIHLYNCLNFTTLILPEYSTNINNNSWNIQVHKTAISSIILPQGKNSVGYIHAYDCNNLRIVDITNCLDPLGTLGVNEIKVYNCSSLQTLNIAGISYANYLNCYNNPLMTNIDTHLISSAISITLQQNPGLTTIDLGNLIQVSNFTLGSNINLTSVNLDSLITCAQTVSLSGCPKLTSLMLHSLTSCGGLQIGGNTSLVNLYYEKALVKSSLYIQNINIDNISLYFTAPFYYINTDGYKGTTLDLSMATSCTQQLQLTNMPNLTSLDISNIADGDYTYISGNPKLTSLVLGFTYMKTVLSIYDLPLLTSLQFTKYFNCKSLFIRNTMVQSYDFSNVYTPYISIQRHTNLALNLPQFYDTEITINISQNYGIASMPSISHLRKVDTLDFRKNGLTQAQVDAILNQCLEISLYDTSVKLYLYKWIGGTEYGTINAQPSAQGLADKATLISRGWIVDA